MKYFIFIICWCAVASLSPVINIDYASAESKEQAEENPFTPEEQAEPKAIACGGSGELMSVVGVARAEVEITIENPDGDRPGMNFSSEKECVDFVRNEARRKEVCLLAAKEVLAEEIKKKSGSRDFQSEAMTDCVSKRLQTQLNTDVRCDKTLEPACSDPLEIGDVRHPPCVRYADTNGCDWSTPLHIDHEVAGTKGGGTCLTSQNNSQSHLKSLTCIYNILGYSYGNIQHKCGDCKR